MKAMTDTVVTEITPDGVIVDRQGVKESVPCDTVVVAVGTSPVNPLEHKLRNTVQQLFVVGDAKSPRKAYEAIREGYEAALSIS